MKKRTKITLRTKIYLTIVGLLALTGVLYAANPSNLPLSKSVTGPYATGVAAAPDALLVSDYCARDPVGKIYQVDCDGNVTLFGDGSGLSFGCPGKIHGYRSIAVRGGRVHPARRFHHTRRLDL